MEYLENANSATSKNVVSFWRRRQGKGGRSC